MWLLADHVGVAAGGSIRACQSIFETKIYHVHMAQGHVQSLMLCLNF